MSLWKPKQVERDEPVVGKPQPYANDDSSENKQLLVDPDDESGQVSFG